MSYSVVIATIADLPGGKVALDDINKIPELLPREMFSADMVLYQTQFNTFYVCKDTTGRFGAMRCANGDLVEYQLSEIKYLLVRPPRSFGNEQNRSASVSEVSGS